MFTNLFTFESISYPKLVRIHNNYSNCAHVPVFYLHDLQYRPKLKS